MKHYEEKYGVNPGAILLTGKDQFSHVVSQQEQELHDLFDSVVYEIEDRQKFLEDMTKAGPNKEVEERMKQEIVSRIGELQKIRELINKE